jgi:DNA-binding CsgD family transcriptional regulator
LISQDFLDQVATQHGLSKSEREVLHHAMEGLSTSAIAQKIGISGDAVRKRLSEVYQKFEIKGRGPVKLTKLQQLLMSQYQQQGQAVPPPVVAPQPTEKIDFGEAVDVSTFYGREEELKILQAWITQEKCRLIALLGMRGIGKTALSVKLAQNLQDQFDWVLWRSLRQSPSLQELLAMLIQHFAPSPQPLLKQPVDQQITWLIEFFRSHRCFVILDGVEAILQRGDFAGTYQAGYERYGEFFKRIGQEPHKSCLLLTSQEQLSEIALQEGETSPVRSLTLEGLGDAATLLLKEKGLSGEKNWKMLIQGYRGNPLMLKLVATTIKEIFDGDVSTFLKTTIFTRDISDFIEAILERLSDLEMEVLEQIAQADKPIVISELLEDLSQSPQDIVSALASLRARSLLDKTEEGFTLPPVVRSVIVQ